jgi:hypothetical protein
MISFRYQRYRPFRHNTYEYTSSFLNDADDLGSEHSVSLEPHVGFGGMIGLRGIGQNRLSRRV